MVARRRSWAEDGPVGAASGFHGTASVGGLVEQRESGVVARFHFARTFVVVTFSEALNPVNAEDVGNYTVRDAGADGRFGTRDDRVFAIASVRYDPVQHTVEECPPRAGTDLEPGQFAIDPVQHRHGLSEEPAREAFAGSQQPRREDPQHRDHHRHEVRGRPHWSKDHRHPRGDGPVQVPGDGAVGPLDQRPAQLNAGRLEVLRRVDVTPPAALGERHHS